MDRDVTHPPEGLSRRARFLVQCHGVRLDPLPLEDHRARWLDFGIPPDTIARAMAFEARWGGLVLPPAPVYEGGPRVLGADTPEGSTEQGWWFEAGVQRASVPYEFMIGPNDEFGIRAGTWTPLHASIEGWVESVALAHHAAQWAGSITKITGADVDSLDLDGFEPVPEVGGLADTWWRGRNSLVAVYRGEAECLDSDGSLVAMVYSGLSDWGLNGG